MRNDIVVEQDRYNWGVHIACMSKVKYGKVDVYIDLVNSTLHTLLYFTLWR